MIGIIGALDVEINEIKKSMENIIEYHYGARCFFVGKINDVKIVLVKSLVGKTNAGITTTLLLEHFDIEYVVNVGIAGGIKPLKVFDLVIANKVVYHDVDISPFGYEVGQIPGMPKYYETDKKLVAKAIEVAKTNGMTYHVGAIATGDAFMTKDNIKIEHVIAVEMEGAAIAQVCHTYKKPMIVLRAISDILGVKDQTDNYMKTEEVAGNYASVFVLGFLTQ